MRCDLPSETPQDSTEAVHGAGMRKGILRVVFWETQIAKVRRAGGVIRGVDEWLALYGLEDRFWRRENWLWGRAGDPVVKAECGTVGANHGLDDEFVGESHLLFLGRRFGEGVVTPA